MRFNRNELFFLLVLLSHSNSNILIPGLIFSISPCSFALFKQIGMMRNGILLAEDTPTNIMQKYGCDNLEDAFLVLCQQHGTSEEADTTLGRVAGQKFLATAEIQSVTTDSSSQNEKKEKESTTDADASTNVKRKLKRNLSFHEQKPDSLIGKLTFTSQIRMKALLTKNLLQLIRQPS